MKKWTRFLILAALTLLLIACSTDGATQTPVNETPDTEQEETNPDAETDTENTDPENTDPEKDNGDKETKEFDEQIEGTISLEGMEETITLNLYNNPDALFLTYVPEDLLAEEASGGEGESYKFHANFVGERLEDIFLHIYIFSEQVTKQPSADDEGTTYAEAVKNMELAADNTYYDWAIEEYVSPEGSRIVALGEHTNRYFMVVLNSSVEYSEGFVPRANKVLEYLYWKDTSEYLIKE